MKTNSKSSIVIDNNELIYTYLKARNKSRHDESVDDVAFFHVLLLLTLLLNKKYPIP